MAKVEELVKEERSATVQRHEKFNRWSQCPHQTVEEGRRGPVCPLSLRMSSEGQLYIP